MSPKTLMRIMRIPRQVLAGGAVALVAFTLAGQQPAPQAVPAENTPPTPVTFKTGTTLVIEEVTVKDKSGHLVEGLKQSDFKVTEDGKVQSISVFAFEKLAVEAAPPPELALTDQLELPAPPKTSITLARQDKPDLVAHHNKRLMPFFFDFSSMG